VTRAALWCGTHAGRTIAAATTAMLAAYLSAALLFPKPDHRVVFGDATHHFVQLRSLVFDHDLDFRNEYVRLYRLDGMVPGTEWIYRDLTPTGHVRNYMPIGPALLWAPLYVLLAGIQMLLSIPGWTRPPDGYGLLLQLVPGITGIIAAGAATWISFRIARRFTSAASAAVGALGIWLGSHAIYYTLVSPSYSHAGSMLTAALFVGAWLHMRERPSVSRFAGLGALAGLAALMRWQDAVFLAVPAIDILRWRGASSVDRLRAFVTMGAAAAVVFSPQMVVWTVLYGQPLAIPQGPSFMQWSAPHLAAVLFSDKHGLFSWAPILIAAAAGLVTLVRRQPGLSTGLFALVLPAWYVNAAVADWWAGEAYGARRFLSLYPLFVLGLAVWLHPTARTRVIETRRLVICGVLAAANWLLLFQYEIFMKGLTAVAPYPEGWYNLYVARFVVPLRLLAWWHR
jgi:hypothetical protein